MPIDGSVVNSIVHELKTKVIDGRIDKIYQPEKDEIIISIRAMKENYKLLLTSNPSYPRIHLTEIQKENPQFAPMFCMLLRKYLRNGKIIDIVQPNFERIIEIHILALNEIGDKTIKKLIIEIMGKHSNIILIDENNVVLDSIKHINHEISSVREVYPGTSYFVPPSNKLNPLEITKDYFTKIFSNTNMNDNISKRLLSNFNGFGKVISNEIDYRYSIANESSHFDIEILWEEFSAFIQKIKQNEFVPTLYLDTKNDIPIDFSCLNLLQYINYKSVNFNSISQIIEKYYSEKDLKNRMKQKTDSLRKNITILLDRNKRKLFNLENKIVESKDKDKYKIYGELILSNIHNIKAGDKQLITTNFYSPNQESIKINLKEQLSPSDNAQKYFKKYNKLKRTEKNAVELIKGIKKEIEYLESVVVNLENCVLEDDINAIKMELIDGGYIKRSSLPKKKNKIKSKPLKFRSSDGFTILVGKNNVQNDELTLKTAHKNDVWLHTKTIHGTHVIIRCDNKDVPNSTLLEAATLAAYYSKAKNSSNVEVDYTTVKNVKKPSGSKPGMVIYVNYKTIVVNPDKEIVEKLKA